MDADSKEVLDCLIAACKVNDEESLVRCLQRIHTVDIIDQADATGWTALQVACNYGSLGCANLLILHGANVNKSRKMGILPHTLHPTRAIRNVWSFLFGMGLTYIKLMIVS